MQKIEDNIRDKAPGVMVRAYQGGKIVCDVSVGNTYAYYDLASLTKIICRDGKGFAVNGGGVPHLKLCCDRNRAFACKCGRENKRTVVFTQAARAAVVKTGNPLTPRALGVFVLQATNQRKWFAFPLA